MKRYFSILILIFQSFVLKAEFKHTENLNLAFNSMFELQFSKSRHFINKEKEENPKNYLLFYYENYLDFIELLVNEDNTKIKEFEKKSLIHLKKISKNGKKDNPYYFSTQAEIRLRISLIELAYNNYWNAGINIYKSHSLWEKSIKKHEKFFLNKKLESLFLIFFDAIPDNYRWVRNLFGFSGDVEKGLNILHNLWKKDTKNIELILLYSTVCQFFAKNDDISFSFLAKIKNKKIEANPLLKMVYAKAAMKAGENTKAIEILKNYSLQKNTFHLSQIYYLLGKAQLNKLDKEAEKSLLKFLFYFKGRTYKKSAYLKLCWFYFLNKNELQLNFYTQKLNENKNAILDIDKQSLKEISKIHTWDTTLLKSRLLFDGGYYKTSLEILKQKASYYTGNQLIEYHYRLARIYHKTKKTDQAIKNYLTVLKKGKNEIIYFIPFSALQIGYLKEKNKKYNSAKKWYKKALELNNGEYKNSIERKAKTALNRIKKFLN